MHINTVADQRRSGIKLLCYMTYLTLPYGEGELPPSAEASSGPNAHPQINP